MRKVILGVVLATIVGGGLLLSVLVARSSAKSAQLAAQSITWGEMKDCYRDPASCPPPPPPPPPKDG